MKTMQPTDDDQARLDGPESGEATHRQTIRLARKVMGKLGPPPARGARGGGLALVQIPGDPASDAGGRPWSPPVGRPGQRAGSCWLVVTFEGAVPNSRGLLVIAPPGRPAAQRLHRDFR